MLISNIKVSHHIHESNSPIELSNHHCVILIFLMVDLPTLKSPTIFINKTRTIFMNKTHTISLWFLVYSYCCRKWFRSFSSKIKKQESFNCSNQPVGAEQHCKNRLK